MLDDLRYRLRAIFRRGALERELDDELRFHLEHHINAEMKKGHSREEAERRARLMFGGVDRAKEASRDARGVSPLEILSRDLRYAIRLLLTPGTFNLCPADYCELPGMADGVSGRGMPVERYEPPPQLVEQARRLVAEAGMDVGGVEYLVSARDGEAYFYDVNALSNFVADAVNVIGFNPYVDLAELIVARAGLGAAASAA